MVTKMTLDGISVLLAEDNPTNQMVAMQMLETLGARVTLAVDGAEALEILDERSFDIALIDIEMPRISGIDLIKHLRRSESPVADMPMIALTAYVMREHRAAIDDAGADGIIAKPILSIEQFGDDIATYMRARGRQASADVAVAPIEAAEPEPDPIPAEIDHEVFDRLMAVFDGDRRTELLSQVATDIDEASVRFEAGRSVLDYGEIRAATHVLISVSGAIGASRLQSLSQCLNSAGHTTDDAAIEHDGAELLSEAKRVIAFVHAR